MDVKSADHSQDMHLYQQLRVNPVKSTKNPEYGYGYIKSEPDANGLVKVDFINPKKSIQLPIQDFTNPNGQQELPSNSRNTSSPTQYDDNIQYAQSPEFQRFLKYVWDNGFILASVATDRQDEFIKWYEEVTGQKPNMTKGNGISIYKSLENSVPWTGRIDFTKDIPEDVTKPKELVVKPSGGVYHINSTPFVKQLVRRGFRFGNNLKTQGSYQQFMDNFAPKPTAVDIETQVDTSELEKPIDQSLDNITQFFNK